MNESDFGLFLFHFYSFRIITDICTRQIIVGDMILLIRTMECGRSEMKMSGMDGLQKKKSRTYEAIIAKSLNVVGVFVVFFFFFKRAGLSVNIRTASYIGVFLNDCWGGGK